MEKILFGTGNQTRLEYLKGILAGLPIELVSLKDQNIELRIEEDGKSPIENSKKKALGYRRISRLPTFSIDSWLYLDAFADDEQPGVFVKQISDDVREASDEDMLKYYISALEKYGGKSNGCWKIALTFVKTDEEVYTTVFERETIFISEKCDAWSKNEPLNSIQIDLRTGKYEAELTVEEKIESQRKMVKHIYDFMEKHI